MSDDDTGQTPKLAMEWDVRGGVQKLLGVLARGAEEAAACAMHNFEQEQEANLESAGRILDQYDRLLALNPECEIASFQQYLGDAPELAKLAARFEGYELRRQERHLAKLRASLPAEVAQPKAPRQAKTRPRAKRRGRVPKGKNQR